MGVAQLCIFCGVKCKLLHMKTRGSMHNVYLEFVSKKLPCFKCGTINDWPILWDICMAIVYKRNNHTVHLELSGFFCNN